jgi:hypothetical protein
MTGRLYCQNQKKISIVLASQPMICDDGSPPGVSSFMLSVDPGMRRSTRFAM